jgi:hypothetical protein
MFSKRIVALGLPTTKDGEQVRADIERDTVLTAYETVDQVPPYRKLSGLRQSA